MADDWSKSAGGDRATRSRSEGDEVAFFAKQHGLTRQRAEGRVKEQGHRRPKLDSAAGAHP